MEMHQLRYFTAVAELGSFSRAAKQCEVAQPSLSQQIKRLEESLGTRLFDRLGRRIAMTDAGRALLPRAKRILAEVRDATEHLNDDDLGTSLNIGAIPTMAPYLLPAPLKAFLSEHPKCQLTVREDFTERLVEALVECELDCAIMSTPIDHELIETEVIATERLLVVTPRQFAVPDTEHLRLADLRHQPTIVLHEMHCLGQQITDFCAQRRVSPRIVCRSTQLTTVLRLVGLGMGISLVPEMCANAETQRDLQFLPITRGGPNRDIAIAWRSGRSRSRTAEAFAQVLRETAFTS